MISLRGTRRSSWSAALGAAMLLGALPSTAHAIPAWARKYNMDCTGCHFPVPPVLNADGLAFKWAGYRMPDQIGKNVEVTKIGDYLAARGVFQYAYAKTSDSPADVSEFSVPSVSLFAAGPLGKWFGAFIEVEAAPDGIGTAIQATGTWGEEDGFGSVRFVQGHLISEGAVAGFDRAIGVLTPLPVDGIVTNAIPYSFGDHTGLDVSWVLGKKNRAAIGVSNSNPNMVDGTSTTKQDFVISDQYIWDVHGGGLAVAGVFGNVMGADLVDASATSHFTRVAVTANHYFGNIEAIGGYVYGKDTDLPTVNDVFSTSTMTGQAYWLGAGYTVPKSYLTFYGRWEYLNPDKSVVDGAGTRWVLGGVAPLMTPEYIRLGLEYFHDSYQYAGSPTRQGLFLELQMAY